MRLQPRIVRSTIVLVTIIVGLTGGLFLYLLRNTLYTQIGENALDVARRRHAVQVLLVLVVGFSIAIPGAMLLAGGIMRLFDFPPAPLLLSLVLGDLMEQAMRQSLTLSNGDVAIFFTRPISLTLLILSALSVLYPIIRQVREKRRKTGVAA
jgi:TctA family transporter